MADYRNDTMNRERDRYRNYGREDRSIFGTDRHQHEHRGRRRESGWRDEDRERWSSREDRGWGARDEEGRGRRERRYGPDDTRSGLPVDETSHLIASNKVEGTAVYGPEGERFGDIYNFMVDKISGRVEYAVMSYGGFLGIGERYFPLPWDMLTYDTRAGGYRLDMTWDELKRAPSFDRESEPRFNRDYSQRVHDYYGIRY